MTADEIWNALHSKMTKKERKEANEALAHLRTIYEGLIDMALSPEAKDILKQEDNRQNGFLCFIIGRSAPEMWDDFVAKDPFKPNKESEKYFDKCQELFFKDETVHFVSQYYGLALFFFQVAAYMGSVEEGKTERVKV